MAREILIEIDLGQRAAERCDIAAFLDTKLVVTYYDRSYADLPNLAQELRAEYPDAEIEAWCEGQDCAGSTHRWKIEL
jgi:hypothetical protein